MITDGRRAARWNDAQWEVFDRLATHDTDHLLQSLEAWRGVGGDKQADAIEAELVERGVPYSDFKQEEAHH